VGGTIAAAALARMTSHVLVGDSWHEEDADAASLAGSLMDPTRLIWVDVEGMSQDAEEVLRSLVPATHDLEGLDPQRAADGGEVPTRRPPKTKVLRHVVFARAYWLGGIEAAGRERELTQEVHLIAGRTFVISLRYPIQMWDVDRMAWSAAADPGLGARARGFDIANAREDLTQLRRRFGRNGSAEAFGLEAAAVVIDQLFDSVFDALHVLRVRADRLEERVMDPSWRSERKGKSQVVGEQTLRVRRLVRQIRWAFLPADELSELIGAPFLAVEDRGIRSRFDDLGRESARAVETVRDIADQVQQTVELADSMKTDRLNATIYVLTVVATVLVVPTLIAGIYGMNFNVIPGARAHAGFWIVIFVMVVVSVAVWFGIRRYLDRVFRQGP
jgi:hypothetical protein